MFVSRKPMILASNSPRRKAFLQDAGLDFTVEAASIDESVHAFEKPEQYVKRMAVAKGEKLSSLYPDEWIVAADTIVVCDEKILGKPEDEKQAEDMLSSLSGQSHFVFTAFYVGCGVEKITTVEMVRTEVTFSDLSPELIRAYVTTGEPMDKAGAYGIQGLGGNLVKKVTGSYTNVVGLPMAELLEVLKKYSVI